MLRKLRYQIYELDLSAWRVVTERLTRYLPSRVMKLVLYVNSGFFERIGSSGTRPEINEPLNMRKGFLAGEFLPDFR